MEGTCPIPLWDLSEKISQSEAQQPVIITRTTSQSCLDDRIRRVQSQIGRIPNFHPRLDRDTTSRASDRAPAVPLGSSVPPTTSDPQDSTQSCPSGVMFRRTVLATPHPSSQPFGIKRSPATPTDNLGLSRNLKDFCLQGDKAIKVLDRVYMSWSL